MDDKAIIRCKKCSSALRVPPDRGALEIRCPDCQTKFIWKPDISQQLKAGYFKIRSQSWPHWFKIAITPTTIHMASSSTWPVFVSDERDKPGGSSSVSMRQVQ